MRIVSLLPSATEIVCVLGLGDQLVGVTHECDFPEFVRGLPKVTRTLIPKDTSSGEIDRLVREQRKTERALYILDLPALERLRPDLIVTQALCGVCAVADEEVRAAACTLPGTPRVINLEPESLAQVLDAIREVGHAANRSDVADEVVADLSHRVEAVVGRTAGIHHHPRVALLEWLDPPFSCGHWSPQLVSMAGGIEGFGRDGQPSRRLAWDEVCAFAPDVVMIACCGFTVERTFADMPLLNAVPGWNEMPAVRSGRVYVVDGSQYFSRPGPRLVDSLEILAHGLHPEAHPLPAGVPAPARVDRATVQAR